MDARLTKIHVLGPLRLQLLIEDEFAVEPEPRVPFFRILRPMNVHREAMPFADAELVLPVDAVPPEIANTVLDRGASAFPRLDPPRHHVVVPRRRLALPVEEVVAILG